MKSASIRESARPVSVPDASESEGGQNTASSSQQPAADTAPASPSGPLRHLHSARPMRPQAGESSRSRPAQEAASSSAFFAAIELAQEMAPRTPASPGGLRMLAETASTIDASIEHIPAQSSRAHIRIPHALTTASIAKSAGISQPAITQSEVDRILNDALSGAFQRPAMTTAEVVKIAQMPNSQLRAILIKTLSEAIDEAINKPVATTVAGVVNQPGHQLSMSSGEVISLAKAIEKVRMPGAGVQSILTNALSRSVKRIVTSLEEVTKLASSRADSHRMSLAEVVNVADVLKKTLQTQHPRQKQRKVLKPDAQASVLGAQTAKRLFKDHGLTKDDVVAIASNVGGERALESVLRLLPRLCKDHGLNPREVVAIASHDGGKQALETVLQLLPRLCMDHGLTSRQVVAIASHHDGKQALETVQRLLPRLCKEHGLNPDDVAAIASSGGKRALETVLRLLSIGVTRDAALASTTTNKRKRETQVAQADAAPVKRQRTQTGTAQPAGEPLSRPSYNAQLQEAAVNWLAQRFPYAFGTAEGPSNANAAADEAKMPVHDEQLVSILAQSPTRGSDPSASASGGLSMEELAGSALAK